MLGPNGAGKTTLAAHARRARRRSTRGRIALDGEVVDEPSTSTLRRARTPLGRRGVPGLPAVPAPDGARERGVRAAEPRRAARRGPPPRRRVARPGSGWPTAPARSPRDALRRAAAARRARAGARDRAPTAAARRAARRARRRDAHRAAPRPARAPRVVRRVRVLVTHDLARRGRARRPPRRARERARRAVGYGRARCRTRPRSRYVADLVGVNLLRGTAHGPRGHARRAAASW